MQAGQSVSSSGPSKQFREENHVISQLSGDCKRNVHLHLRVSGLIRLVMFYSAQWVIRRHSDT